MEDDESAILPVIVQDGELLSSGEVFGILSYLTVSSAFEVCVRLSHPKGKDIQITWMSLNPCVF